MADEFGLTKNVAAPPVPQQAQPLPQRETPALTMATTPIAQELDRMSSSPTVLGEIGANMALQAGVKQAEIIGQYQGLNPSGEVLPPITKVDEAYVKSYSLQSQATLGLQLQKMMDDGVANLDKDYELSPGKIAAFTQSMAEASKNITSLAPSTVRADLENNFAHSLEKTTFQLTESQISQQKERSRSAQLAYQSHLQDQIHDAWMSGNSAQANKLYSNLQSSIQSAASIGMITPLQAETAIQSAKISSETGKQIATVMQLQEKKDGSYEKYLSDMVTNKPKNVSWTEWEKVRTGTMSYMGQVENFQQRQETSMYSQGISEISNGSFNDSKAAYYKSQLSPQRYNSLMTSYYNHQRKTAKGQFQAQQLAAHADNPDAYYGAKADQINGTHAILTQGNLDAAKAANKPIDFDAAALQAQQAMAVPAPAYIKHLSESLHSGNPQKMDRALEAFEKLREQNPNKVAGFDERDIAMGALYTTLKSYNGDPVYAAQSAFDVMNKKDKTDYELNKAATDTYLKKTPAQLDSWANKLLGAQAPAYNQTELTSDATRLFSAFMQLTDRNIDASLKATESALKMEYGVTEVNGRPQTARLTVESATNIYGATPLFQEDIYGQLKAQMDVSNKALEQSKTPWRWELKPRITAKEYLAAKKEYEELQENKPSPTVIAGGLGQEYVKKTFELKDKMDSYLNGSQIEINKVYKDHVETYKAGIRAPLSMQKSSDGQILGDWQIELRDERGMPHNMTGFYGGLTTYPVYRPNVQSIRNAYLAIYNRPYSWDEFVKNHMGVRPDSGLEHPFMHLL